MRTRLIPPENDEEIADVLRNGGLVALPTETVYGLAARAEDESAVRRIFQVKGRPMDNPLIVHTATPAQALSLADEIPDYARHLAGRFWPGPLTLVLRSAVDWPWVQAGHGTIGVRVPEPEYLRALIRKVGPLAAPSANPSGRPSPTTAAHCQADLNGLVPLIVDGGRCRGGLESTVVDCTGERPLVLRPGPISREEIDGAVHASGAGSGDSGSDPRGAESTDGSDPEGARSPEGVSPGTRHPHYRPHARVVLVENAAEVDDPDAMVIRPAIGQRPRHAGHDRSWSTLEELARHLYAWFREADGLGVHVVYVERLDESGLGHALMNRIERAAGG